MPNPWWNRNSGGGAGASPVYGPPTTNTAGTTGTGGTRPLQLPVHAIPTPQNLQQLGTMADSINAINRRGQTAANQARIPGGAQLEQQSSSVIGDELAGRVPADVLNLLRQQGAEGGINSGGNPHAAFLRALGLTSVQQQQLGQQNLSAADARNPIAPLFDPTSQLLSPGQAGQLGLGLGNLDLQNREEDNRARAENERLRLQAEELALRHNAGAGGGGGGGGGGRSDGGMPPGAFSPGFNTVGGGGPLSGQTGTGDLNAWYQMLGQDMGGAGPATTPISETDLYGGQGPVTDLPPWAGGGDISQQPWNTDYGDVPSE